MLITLAALLIMALIIGRLVDAVASRRLRQWLRTGGVGALFEPTTISKEQGSSEIKNAIGSGGVVLLTSQRPKSDVAVRYP
jgi:hypothetical protein